MIQPIQVSTVIVGSWNPKIFTPAWVKKNLFVLESNQEIQGLVNFDEMDFGFEWQGVTILPKSNVFEIRFDSYTEAKAILVSTIVVKVLELLPQTPVKALGVNMTYQLGKADESAFVRTVKGIHSKFREFNLSQTKHSFNKEHYQINIITDISDVGLNTNFNFHYSKIAAYGPKFIVEHYKETQLLLTDGNS